VTAVDSFALPAALPVPLQDGAALHLDGARVPALRLWSTRDRWVDLRDASVRRVVLFFYPRTGRPGEPIAEGWDEIPGARG
jgi:hypothetical protein